MSRDAGRHVTPGRASAYADGTLPEPQAWALESHVESCVPCARLVSAAARSGSAGPVLREVRAEVLAEVLAAAPEEAGGPAPATAGGTSAVDSPGPQARAARRHAPAPGGAAVVRPTGGPDGPLPGPAAPGPAIPRAAAATAGPGAAGPGAAGSGAAGSGADRHGRPGREERTGPVRPSRPSHPRPPARHRLFRPRPPVRDGGPPRRGPSLAARLAWSARSAGPALGRSWLLSLVLVTAAAVLLARASGTAAARPLLLAVAPLLPVAGVAASYGRHSDPLYEAVAATPAAGIRLLLVRTGWVLAVCVPLLTAAGLLMPAPDGGPGAHAWLLPGLALTLLTLLAASGVGCLRAAAGTGTGWLLLLAATGAAADAGGAGPAGPADPAALLTASLGALSGTPAQGAWAGTAVLCGGLLVLRRTSFDRLERL
ncbi:zf-HC2 domain-containing protein [Streptomyces sp. F63]|uniref:zf-HC2 domain-containing protein n=1 Tax=Streptomyces sp. F63 TaxID=2824887 RepID=UPI001B374889|nr:zf-HC2 domain-containing protein [Streptomyces sp. F63]MBQ0983950.1 zf-HC2 domain-containing protein [Streptomyces sp. F63]